MKKILIVEDEETLANVISDKLSQEKYRTFIARNGRDGLDAALKEKPDLILLDIIMPVMDGLAMLKELRQDKWGSTAKVIILTNLTEAETTAEAMEHGVHDFLVKTDWKLEDIVKKVKDILK